MLPARVQVAPGEQVVAAKEGLLALSVGVGLGVMHELTAEEACGPGVSTTLNDPSTVMARTTVR